MKLLQQGEKNRKYQKIRRRNRIKTWNKPKVYGVDYCITRARLAKGLQKKRKKKGGRRSRRRKQKNTTRKKQSKKKINQIMKKKN